MANSKHSVAREIIIDRLLHKRRGYSVYEMLDIVNKSLEFEGFGPVSITTIRRDIETIKYRYKQKLDAEKRSYYIYFRYSDPNFTIYSNVLTFGEIQHLHSALLSIRFVDPLQGTLMYKELSKRLADMLDIDPASDPIVLYKKVPSKNDCKRFKALYNYIRNKTPINLTYRSADKITMKDVVIHPYFIYLEGMVYYLLGHVSADKEGPAKIPITSIVQISPAYNTDFIPNQDYPLDVFYSKHILKGL